MTGLSNMQEVSMEPTLIGKTYKGKTVIFREVSLEEESVFDCVTVIKNSKGKDRYICNENIGYYSKRYSRWVIREAADSSDGATCAKDIDSFGWLFHDELCDTGLWENDEPCTNWQASQVLQDILDEEGYWFRKFSWFWSTWAFGGGKLRKNGMW